MLAPGVYTSGSRTTKRERGTLNFEAQKSELDAILASGIFNRAPNLALVLKYVCARHFDGEADQLKEYNIAVEALGRPENFDSRADSIVRVEMHRLRKRLREYYEGDGASHPVHIEIPPGQYAPRFIHLDAAPELPAAERPSQPAEPEAPPIPSAPSAPPQRPSPMFFRRPSVWIGIAALLIIAVAVPMRFSISAHSRPTPVPLDPAGATAASEDVRILCGMPEGSYVDHQGNTWSADRYFEGGIVGNALNHPIRGTVDQRLYNSRREGAFQYHIPLKPGVYELRLHFAETMYGENNPAGGGESSRVFNVYAGDRELLPYFDVVGDTGSNMADVKVFKDITPGPDGKLNLRFEPISNQPILSGIEITPGIKGRLKPIRMVAQDHGHTDRDGNYWEPDRYVTGGVLVSRSEVPRSAADPDLYRGERYGNFSYQIPVADGSYDVLLHFAETWFGPGKPGGGGQGSRLFDIFCNGALIRRTFDVYADAGAPDRATTVAIRDVASNPQGKIVISLSPVVNYAFLNAIEVVDRGR